MPRKLLTISNFHGGLDEISSEVDLQSGYFPNLTDVMVDRLGQIVPMGDFNNAPTDNPTATGFIVHSSPGYGLYAFRSSRRLSGVQADCVIYVVQQFVASDKGENFIFWDNAGGDDWAQFADSGNNGDLASHVLDLEDSALDGHFLPDYFVFNNILRIADGNMDNIVDLTVEAFDFDTYRGWVGYVQRTHFPNANPGNSADTYSDWYGYTSPTPAMPTKGFASKYVIGTANGSDTNTMNATNIGEGLTNVLTADNDYLLYHEDGTDPDAWIIQRATNAAIDLQSGVWTDAGSAPDSGDVYRLYPPAGSGLVLNADPSNTGGFLPSANYTWGTTFVYDGNQESQVFEMTNGFGSASGFYGIDTGDAGKIEATALFYAPYHPRVSGMRIYLKSDQDVFRQWYLAWDIDFARGARLGLANSNFQEDTAGTPFTKDALHGDAAQLGVYITLPDLLALGDSYDVINGYSADESIDIRYATSTIVSGIVYVGNVYKEVNGVAGHYPSRIWSCAKPTYSPSPAVDIFPETYWTEDPAGDTIVKLESIGNKLLSFSKNNLTVLTVTVDGTLTTGGTFSGYGIDKPAHVTKVPGGVVFANNNGVFRFDGEVIKDLLMKDYPGEKD